MGYRGCQGSSGVSDGALEGFQSAFVRFQGVAIRFHGRFERFQVVLLQVNNAKNDTCCLLTRRVNEFQVQLDGFKVLLGF